MKFRIFARSLCALALLAAATGPALAQTVEIVTLGKHIEYVQTSATEVKVNPQPQGPLYGGPFGFSVNVEGINMGALAAPIVSGPFNIASLGSFFNNGRLVLNTSEGIWRLGFPNANDWGSPTLADLESKFGNGTYTVNVAGASVPLNLTGGAYPNAPLLTLTGGYWSNGKYMLDADKPLTITTGAFTGYGSHVDDRIAIFTGGFGENAQLASQVPGNTRTHTVPASTFTAGRAYEVGAYFLALTDVRTIAALPGSYNAAFYGASTKVDLVVSAPVFPMVVTSNITPTVANVTAAIEYRPQDVGSTGSVYVFALAPVSLVKPSAAPLETYGFTRGNAKNTPLPCVLAQLSTSGQLTSASSSSLQAYLTGVLGSQGATVSVLNNVSTAIVQGAVFYVGYGSSSIAMLNGGINRSAVTVPASATCQPQPPETGWWWNRNEPGRGFSIETQGNRLFMAGYLYDATGRPTWVVSGGLTSLDGSFFHGDLQAYSGGQTLTGAYKAPAAPTSLGQVTLAFTDARSGTLVWPGGTIPVERFTIAPPTSAAKYSFVPENGWWWNPAESGRGYFMEFGNNSAFVAGYMYNDTGSPLWYAAGSATMPSSTSFQAPWDQYANGQTLTGAHRAPALATSPGALGIQFQSAASATLTLPGGRQVQVVRFGF